MEFFLTYPVYVVDEDRRSRVSTSLALNACGLETRPFVSSADFFDAVPELQPGAVLLRYHDSSSMAFSLLRKMQEQRTLCPAVVIAGTISIPQAVAMMRLGAVDVVEQTDGTALNLAALDVAFAELPMRLRVAKLRKRLEKLSPREYEILQGLLAGQPNKQIANQLGISVRTVEMHRSTLMLQLEASSLAGAIQIALQAGVEPLGQTVRQA